MNNQQSLLSYLYRTALVLALWSQVVVQSFTIPAHLSPATARASASAASTSNRNNAVQLNMGEKWEFEIGMPPSNSGLQALVRMESILDGPSEMIEVRYKLPFGLDVQPQKGLAVCTKDGTGGEKVGDVLRFSSQWTMGLPRGDGLISTAASFSGGIGWQCSLFDVMKAKNWDMVVEALTSNVPARTDEVLLIFERPLKE
mmetsp:Transcript_1636/g.2347  ORF Transcript_1636/g.2347 Transcript_1636/m.2347 type:complete len:200 (+) Transcript_1636:79-678(+)|eukprot:CAMPEP_0203721036 /NCGR_PEP_ID=MMETSP0092-20131115/4621_1 /ASSEMBLY_ACC=CAM_ASM_001090 /TAXON_ID=426623 /ORGANISM="Chaetoceros affinis, Strain CCMP159" /LENGTH=199 /DNA_ID=CAMNT_0050600835 /DNA_START=69 /DNA_END=668 /DNA_ORIENTATION=-